MILHTVGADPGATGGAALLAPDGRTVSAWLAWAWLEGGGGRFRLRGPNSFEVSASSMHLVSCQLAGWAPYRLVLEGLFVAHGRGRAAKGKRRSLLPLAESAGELLGPLRAGAAGEVLRPNAQREWRPEILGLPPDTNAKEAEERAVSWARRNLVWSVELPRRGLTYGEEGAVCEAACMAVWGWRQAEAVRA